MSIAGYASWPAYDTFLIVSLSGQPIYDPNPLRLNPNPKKPVSGSCRVHGLDRTLTLLLWCIFLHWLKRKRKWWLRVVKGGLCDNQIKKKEKKNLRVHLVILTLGLVIYITWNYKSLPSLDSLVVIKADNPREKTT